MNAVFYITFYFDQGDPTQRRAFYIDRLTSPVDEMEEHLARCADQLNHGQVDWAMGRTIAGIKVFGCSSFMGPSKHDKMVEAWRQIFRDAEPDCVLGPVCAVNARTKELADIMELPRQAYEQQQAEQLRDTLNAHITTGSPTARKKI